MHAAGVVAQVLRVRPFGCGGRQGHGKDHVVAGVADLRPRRKQLLFTVDLDHHRLHVPDLAVHRILGNAAEGRRENRRRRRLVRGLRGRGARRRDEENEQEASHQASMISKSRVTSAVLTIMAVAEQYFSCVSLTAFSTILRFSARPRTVQCMCTLVKTLGSVAARSAVSLTSQPVTSWPLFFRITTTS